MSLCLHKSNKKSKLELVLSFKLTKAKSIVLRSTRTPLTRAAGSLVASGEWKPKDSNYLKGTPL